MDKDATIKTIEDQLRMLQERYRRSMVYDTKIQANAIYDIFDARKTNANRTTSITERAVMIDNIHAKHEKYMTNVNNIDTPPVESVFVFVGHGWNTKRTFDIRSYENFHIIMYDQQRCLTFNNESGGFRPITTMKYRRRTDTKIKTLIDVNTLAKEFSAGVNDFIHFDSETNTTVPDMLIALHGKQNEENIFVEVGERTELNTKVMMLSELITSIGRERSSENVIIQIFACRKNLSYEQKKHIPASFPHQPKKDPMFGKRNVMMKPLILNVNNQLLHGPEMTPSEDIISKIEMETLLFGEDDEDPEDPSSVPFYI
jgi:hypothetical protein